MAKREEDSMFGQAMEDYDAGEASIPEVGLRASGSAGRKFGEAIYAPVQAGIDLMLPEVYTDVKGALLNAAWQKTGIPGLLSDWEESSPRSYRNADAALGLTEAIPLFRALGGGSKLLNTMPDEFHTLNEGWYSGNFIKKIKGIGANLKGTIPAMGDALFDPKEKAVIAETGTGRRRWEEFQEPPKKRVDVGNVQASAYMDMQKKDDLNPDTLVHKLPTVQANTLSKHRLSETDDILQSLKHDYPDAPDDIVADLYARADAGLDQKNAVESLAAGAFNPARSIQELGEKIPGVKNRSKQNDIVVVRDKQAPTARVGAEAMAQAKSTSRSLSRLLSKNGLNKYAKAIGVKVDDLTGEQYYDFLKTSSLFEKGAWRKHRNRLPETETFDPSQATPAGKKAKKSPSLRYNQPGDIQDTYWAARTALRKHGNIDKLTPKQRTVYRAIEQAKDDHGVNMNYDPKTGLIKYRTSYASSEQDLGGVGLAMTFDTKNRKAYSMILDGHDVFGANPSGGVGLRTYSPVQVVEFGEGAYDKPKDTGQKGRDDPRMNAKLDKAIKETEEATGVKYDGGSISKFEKAAVKAGVEQATPTMSQYVDTLYNKAISGQLLTEPTTEEEPQQ